MQADWQALHPMQREMSMSFATSVVFLAEGGANVVAELLMISSVSCAMSSSYAF
jgi:hypothetical protein